MLKVFEEDSDMVGVTNEGDNVSSSVLCRLEEEEVRCVSCGN